MRGIDLVGFPVNPVYLNRMTTVLIATRNRHKVGEIQAILGSGFRCLTLEDFSGAPAVVEDADTFAGNAFKKAQALASWLAQQSSSAESMQFVLADDSGLEVDALGERMRGRHGIAGIEGAKRLFTFPVALPLRLEQIKWVLKWVPSAHGHRADDAQTQRTEQLRN